MPTASPLIGKIASGLRWAFGVLFLFGGLVDIATSPLASLFALVLAILLIPPLWNFVTQKVKLELTGKQWGWAVVSVLVLFVWAQPGKSTQSGNTERSALVAPEQQEERAVRSAPVSAPTSDFIEESCLQVVNTFSHESSYSDLQKGELWKKYKGKKFRWDLEVVEVGEEFLGGYYVQAKCMGSNSLIQDVRIGYGRNAKSKVVNLQKGSVYTITATLKDWSNLVGLSAEG